jgi:uncharacterized protein (DUF952 family)
MQTTIYKVIDKDVWAAAKAVGEFNGAAIDLNDGYIHLSAADQVVETVQKHFAGQDNLLLLSVSTAAMGDQLKWETSRNDQPFPHLYRKLTVADVTAEESLSMNDDGSHNFPDRFHRSGDDCDR